MSTKSEAQEYRLDPIKWLLAIVLVVAGVVANSHYSAEPLLYRVLALVVLAGVVGLIVVNTAKGASIWRLLRESLVEVRKVVWRSEETRLNSSHVAISYAVICLKKQRVHRR